MSTPRLTVLTRMTVTPSWPALVSTLHQPPSASAFKARLTAGLLVRQATAISLEVSSVTRSSPSARERASTYRATRSRSGGNSQSQEETTPESHAATQGMGSWHIRPAE